MTEEELNSIKYLTIGLAKETFKQDWESFGKEDNDYIREKLTLDGYCKGVEDVLKILGNMRQEPKWIPVSERLPKEDGRYLVTVQNLTGYEYLDNNVFECEFFHTDWIFKGWKDNKVIAWMPLPEPHKAESEGKE